MDISKFAPALCSNQCDASVSARRANVHRRSWNLTDVCLLLLKSNRFHEINAKDMCNLCDVMTVEAQESRKVRFASQSDVPEGKRYMMYLFLGHTLSAEAQKHHESSRSVGAAATQLVLGRRI
eukprot:4103299-Amphidinium_carterae.1